MSVTDTVFRGACLASKEVNKLVRPHILRELIKLDREERGTKARVVDKERDIVVTTSPVPEHGRLSFQVVFEGGITAPMRKRIDECFSGELKESLTKILEKNPLGWKYISTKGQELPEGKVTKKYRITIVKEKGPPGKKKDPA